MTSKGRRETSQERATRFKRTEARFDIPARRFLAPANQRLAGLIAIQPGESVLDIRTGGDAIAGLREAWRIVKAGGRVGLSIPGPTNMEPMRTIYLTRLKSYGVDGPERQEGQPVNTPETCYDAMREAGFQRIDVRAEQLGCYLGNGAEWWEIVRSEGLVGFHACLSTRELSRFKAEHVAEVAGLATSKGIWLDLTVIFALGWKA